MSATGHLEIWSGGEADYLIPSTSSVAVFTVGSNAHRVISLPVSVASPPLGEPAGFVDARRLNVCEDITRQRIGSDYRLLFRLLPDRVQVVTLINRRDLNRTIKSLV